MTVERFKREIELRFILDEFYSGESTDHKLGTYYIDKCVSEIISLFNKECDHEETENYQCLYCGRVFKLLDSGEMGWE